MFKNIPSVDKCLKTLLEADPSLATAPQPLLKSLVTTYWDQIRRNIRKGQCSAEAVNSEQWGALLDFVRRGLKPRLRPVLNATGVIIHTNLGRSILAEEASEAVLKAASGYCSLELDLECGGRGSRNALTAPLLRLLTGAEDSLAVNNNAAAVLLMLDSLCSGGETIVSRGQLVEIGGSFRIPDIMRKSGSILKEVGTTNRTTLEDYRNALSEQTRAIMVVHASNFRIIGFHASPSLGELSKLAKTAEVPLLMDLGSGNFLDFSESGLKGEPQVSEIITQGVDLACFSGDKLLGGPQAGIIVGKKRLVEKLKKNHLARALRCDKLCLAALEATLRLYLNPEQARKSIPTAAMIEKNAAVLARNAEILASVLARACNEAGANCQIQLKEAVSAVGGGSFPEWGLPTTLVCLYPENISVEELRLRLLESDPPLLGRIEKNAFCLDPRTLPEKDYALATRIIVNALFGKQDHCSV